MTALVDLLAAAWIGTLVHLVQTTFVLALFLVLGRGLRAAAPRANHALLMLGLVKIALPAAVVAAALRALLGPAAAGPGGDWASAATVEILVRPEALPGLPAGASARAAVVLGATLLWAGGFAFLVLRAIARLRRAARATNAALPAEALRPEERAALDRALRDARVPAASVRVVAGAASPAVVGLVRPRIVFSRRLLTALAPAELAAVLAHEEAHRRRHDPLRLFVHHVVASAFFFFPPVWLLTRRLRESIEDLCDERVLRSGWRAPDYARAIARTIRLGLEREALAPAVLGWGGSSLARRLAGLAGLERKRIMLRHRLYLLLAAGLLVAGSLVTPVPVVSDDESEDGKTETEPTPPEIVESVTPEYPPEAFEEGIEGRTVLAVVVDSEGKVTRVGIAESSGREDFDAAAREALVQWKFRPAERDGEPVEMQMLVPIEFALGDRSAHHDEDCDEPHDEHHDEHHDDDAKHHDGHDEHPDEHHDSSGHGHGHHH